MTGAFGIVKLGWFLSFLSKKVEERGFWGSKFCFEILS